MPSENNGAQAKPEFELILLIVSADANATAGKIARLDTIGVYRLIHQPTKQLHDIYLDTPDHLLGKKRINLRIRGSKDDYWITLKISPGLFTRNRHERQELELPWSSESLTRVIEVLAKKGVRLNLPPVADDSLRQVDVMRGMGLQVLQDRETERVVRDVVDANDGEVIAELEIDSVLYHFDTMDIRLSEVELEAKSRRGREVLHNISNRLLQDFRSDLRRWGYGKLVTGERIEKLLRSGKLKGLVVDSRLDPDAYAIIENG